MSARTWKRRDDARRTALDRRVAANRDARNRWPVQLRINGALVQKLHMPAEQRS